jgi:hypothetical protein
MIWINNLIEKMLNSQWLVYWSFSILLTQTNWFLTKCMTIRAVMDSHGPIYWPFGILLTQCNWLGSNTWPLGQWWTAMVLFSRQVTYRSVHKADWTASSPSGKLLQLGKRLGHDLHFMSPGLHKFLSYSPENWSQI